MARPTKKFQAFKDLTDRSHAAHLTAAAKNPNKRGPNPKTKDAT